MLFLHVERVWYMWEDKDRFGMTQPPLKNHMETHISLTFRRREDERGGGAVGVSSRSLLSLLDELQVSCIQDPANGVCPHAQPRDHMYES